jgi:hypothetical protein
VIVLATIVAVEIPVAATLGAEIFEYGVDRVGDAPFEKITFRSTWTSRMFLGSISLSDFFSPQIFLRSL